MNFLKNQTSPPFRIPGGWNSNSPTIGNVCPLVTIPKYINRKTVIPELRWYLKRRN